MEFQHWHPGWGGGGGGGGGAWGRVYRTKIVSNPTVTSDGGPYIRLIYIYVFIAAPSEDRICDKPAAVA